MTAFPTSPFLTVPSGAASFTDAVTMSPSRAYRPVDPPMGLMIAILRAPELSATSRIERIWIMVSSSVSAGRQTVLAFSTMRVTTHRLRRLSGRDGTSATRSPTFASFFSSCAMNFDVSFCCLPYIPWRTWRSIVTVTLLCILSLTTMPTTSALAIRLVLDPLLAEHRLHARELLAERAHLVPRLGLPHRPLDAQAKHLIVEIARSLTEIVRRET